MKATSIRNAIAASNKKLSVVTGLVSLYKNRQALRVHPVAIVRTDGNETRFTQSEQAFRRLYPRAGPQHDLRAALDLIETSPKIDQRLLGAIELLSLASESSDSRVRLINLWSSIETLCGGHEGSATLDRVSSLLVPLIISRYVGRAIRYLAIETQRFGQFIQRYDFGDGFPNARKNYIPPRDMLKTLASPPHSKPICDLLSFVSHPLLRFRIWRSWEVFHDPKQLRSMLLRSKRRLEWHIARIYRARNLLIHQGEESPFLVPLLDNLQIYLSMAVQRLLHELKKHPTWDIRHAMEFWNGRMDYVLTSLGESASVLAMDDFLDGDSREKIWSSA